MNVSSRPAAPNGPRLPLIDQPSDADGAALFDAIRARRGGVLNLHRMMVYAPALMQASYDAAMAIRNGLHVPRPLVELVILRTAQLCGSTYEWQQHLPMALANGSSRDKIDALPDYRESPLYGESERAALAFCDAVVSGEEPSGADFELLRKHFSPREIVELAQIACNYLATARFIHAFRIPEEPSPKK